MAGYKKLFSPHENFLLINASKQQTYKSKVNTEMKQVEYPTAKPTLKRWINRNPTVEPRWARQKTEQASTNFVERFRPESSLSLRPDVQLKRAAKLLTVIELTTKHAVCRITLMLYPINMPLFRHLSYLVVKCNIRENASQK